MTSGGTGRRSKRRTILRRRTTCWNSTAEPYRARDARNRRNPRVPAVSHDGPYGVRVHAVKQTPFLSLFVHRLSPAAA
jgi:hypothetical protein